MIQIIIPARYDSVRLPGKPLIKLNGVEMLLHVYKSAIWVYENWQNDSIKMLPPLIATDSEIVASFCKINSLNYTITDAAKTGTDRVYLASKNHNPEFIINLQGDEPILPYQFLADFCQQSIDSCNNEKILNAVCSLSEGRAKDENNVKAVLSQNGLVMFLTRSIQASFGKNYSLGYYKQVGLYGFTRSSLQYFCALPPSNLEAISSIELMRWLDNGFKISSFICDKSTYSVDTVEDAILVERILEIFPLS